jgi:hypothetical protein
MLWVIVHLRANGDVKFVQGPFADYELALNTAKLWKLNPDTYYVDALYSADVKPLQISGKPA